MRFCCDIYVYIAGREETGEVVQKTIKTPKIDKAELTALEKCGIKVCWLKYSLLCD